MPWKIVIAVAENRLSTERSIAMANTSRIRVKIPGESKKYRKEKIIIKKILKSEGR